MTALGNGGDDDFGLAWADNALFTPLGLVAGQRILKVDLWQLHCENSCIYFDLHIEGVRFLKL